ESLVSNREDARGAIQPVSYVFEDTARTTGGRIRTAISPRPRPPQRYPLLFLPNPRPTCVLLRQALPPTLLRRAKYPEKCAVLSSHRIGWPPSISISATCRRRRAGPTTPSPRSAAGS